VCQKCQGPNAISQNQEQSNRIQIKARLANNVHADCPTGKQEGSEGKKKRNREDNSPERICQQLRLENQDQWRRKIQRTREVEYNNIIAKIKNQENHNISTINQITPSASKEMQQQLQKNITREFTKYNEEKQKNLKNCTNYNQHSSNENLQNTAEQKYYFTGAKIKPEFKIPFEKNATSMDIENYTIFADDTTLYINNNEKKEHTAAKLITYNHILKTRNLQNQWSKVEAVTRRRGVIKKTKQDQKKSKKIKGGKKKGLNQNKSKKAKQMRATRPHSMK